MYEVKAWPMQIPRVRNMHLLTKKPNFCDGLYEARGAAQVGGIAGDALREVGSDQITGDHTGHSKKF